VRVAALYEVHGNLPALDAVLAEAADADVVLFGRDLVAGAFPRETLALARSLPHALFVRGNGDELDRPSGVPAWQVEKDWLREVLDPEERRFLAELPFSASLDGVLYVHANPFDVTTVHVETTPEARLEQWGAPVEEQRVVFGHVHMQFRRLAAGLEWVCAGSVGSPFEDGPGAYWLEVEDGAPSFRRTDYDVDAYEAAVRAARLPQEGLLLERYTRAEALALFG
jgi:predicted phosphodiesterase